ncbi:SurA N-terminal domain-containing protein [Frankia sp. Mgl5]|uniref:SurA N-terminal domain-containing protein n=1 Tax=Frankia sp. Mgl5 TaxID=2933793 RepID=UPI00200F087F|nr:SurA N-terminal domain-containing protein [Frankia sp. Mgl5]MCK9931581.1 SurA N-terminal domain-containing protein [Frankia sp. Mgl5]
MKFPRLLAGLGLVVLTGIAGTACTTHAGAAAQVGSSTIETSTVRGIVDRGFEAVSTVPAQQAAQSLDRAELQRRTLTTLVQLQVLESEADRLGVTLSGQDVDAYYQAYAVLQFGSVEAFETRAAAAGFAKEDVGVIVRTGALESAIGDKIAPNTLASVAEARTQYDSIVAQVGKLPLTFEAARPYLQRFLATDQRAVKLRPLLTEAADREHVSINPRFGSWDDKQFAVVSAPGTIATTAAPESALDLTLGS